MKTRIVYPQLWLDEKFAKCNLATKLLFCYLINNIQLGLTPYLHITDRQLMFDTGINTAQLETAKQELEELRWCFFTDNWIFQNHKCAYIDYFRNNQVQDAKVKELEQVPNSVQTAFKQRLNINYKLEIINNKPKGVVKGEYSEITSLQETDFEEIAADYKTTTDFVKSKYEDMVNWHKSSGKSKKDWKFTLRNFVKKDALEAQPKYTKGFEMSESLGYIERN